jgi:hypothetical protein
MSPRQLPNLLQRENGKEVPKADISGLVSPFLGESTSSLRAEEPSENIGVGRRPGCRCLF